jgi:hypothetical protein
MGVPVCIAPCQDSRVYSSFLNDKEDDSVPFVGRGLLWEKFPPLRFYDFSLQILFQEMKIGHL